METTKESQYQFLLDLKKGGGLTALGLMTNAVWHTDPRRLLILLARYKFVAKMLIGKQRVLEVGCGDGFGARLVQQEVASLHAVDFDPVFVRDVNDRMDSARPFECTEHDILSGPVSHGTFDAAYSLDVLEHIEKESEDLFMKNVCTSLSDDGVLIVGMPSIHSQAFASRTSLDGHVNCKDANSLRALMRKYFDNVFLFSMNDEMVHTGFTELAHYFVALCAGKKEEEA